MAHPLTYLVHSTVLLAEADWFTCMNIEVIKADWFTLLNLEVAKPDWFTFASRVLASAHGLTLLQQWWPQPIGPRSNQTKRGHTHRFRQEQPLFAKLIPNPNPTPNSNPNPNPNSNPGVMLR